MIRRYFTRFSSIRVHLIFCSFSYFLLDIIRALSRNCICHSTSKELQKHARKRAQKEEHAPREVSVSRKRVYESSSSSSAANDIDSDDVVHSETILSHERLERLSETKASVDDRFILSTTFAFNIRSNVDCDPRIGSPSHARGTFEQREIGTRENTKRERKETLVGGATRGDAREDSKSERGALCFHEDGYEDEE